MLGPPQPGEGPPLCAAVGSRGIEGSGAVSVWGHSSLLGQRGSARFTHNPCVAVPWGFCASPGLYKGTVWRLPNLQGSESND